MNLADNFDPLGRTSTVPSSGVWFACGRRIGYDPGAREVITASGAPFKVFMRQEGDASHIVTFMPGFPEGSFGWAKLLPHLPDATQMAKLFFDYLGMGDSDKPRGYKYSTAERTDLVEALWRDLGVQSTTLIAFDFSSLVVLEHLRRRLDRSARGEPAGGPEIRGVLIFNGGLFTDGHTHPWYTTPLLRRLPPRARQRLGRSFSRFKMMTRVLWSKDYRVSDAEVRELLAVLSRHDGGFYLGAAAGFVRDHQAEGERLDFAALFEKYQDKVSFLIGGSEEDPFEHRQVDLAKERLGKYGLHTARLPGGHLTAAEQPSALAALITRFVAGLSLAPRHDPSQTL